MVKHPTMKTYGLLELYCYAFVASALDMYD